MGSPAALRIGLPAEAVDGPDPTALPPETNGSMASPLISGHRLGGRERPRLAQCGDELLESEPPLAAAGDGHTPRTVCRRRQRRGISLAPHQQQRATEEMLSDQAPQTRR